MQAGQIIDGKYRVERLLGRGGMGAVYEGLHTLIDRRVAIKVLSPEASSSKDGVARFAREARAAGRIGNDHILDIYDVGTLPDGTQYLVSEYLEGETLASRFEHVGALPPQAIGKLSLQLLTGLAAAHQAGIVHRDLKPDNVFLLRDVRHPPDFVKIIDFGISKFDVGDDSSMSMTRTGTVLGTPYYLSPEQAKGSLVDARSDLYSVGVILYEAVTRRVPFSASNFHELLFKIALEQPTPPEMLVPGLDPAFCGLIRKAMAREAAQRFQSALEMQGAIASWLSLSASAGRGAELCDATTAPGAGKDPTWAPTASNFGATAPQVTFSPRPARTRWRYVAAGALALVGVGLTSLLLLRRAPTNSLPAASGILAASASEAPLPMTLPAPSPVVPDGPPPAPPPPSQPFLDPADPSPPLLPAVEAGRFAHQRRLPNAVRGLGALSAKAPAVRAPASAASAAGATPAGSAGAKLDRDFGY